MITVLVYKHYEEKEENMLRNRKSKKNKLIPALTILGVITIFACIILYNRGMDPNKTNFAEAMNKLKVMQPQGGENTDNKKSELEKIRAEVERSKQAAMEKENQDTAEIENQVKKEDGNQVTGVKGKETQKQTELAKVNDQLGNVYSQLETPKEQEIISTMRLTVSKLEADASYNSSSDQAAVKASYSKLNEESKNRIKFALFTNIDGNSIAELRKTFGL